jgi:ribosomal protein S18 acetylase RimI-like enzyme
MGLVIRPFEDADRAEMTALYAAAWHATYDDVDGAVAIDRVIAALMEGDNPEMFVLGEHDVALVAELDGRLVGGIRGHPRDGELHLSGLYVAPDEQRRGVGAAMLEVLLSRYSAPFAVRADVRPTSMVARRFYARHGFVEIGRGHADVGGNHWIDTIELRRDARP